MGKKTKSKSESNSPTKPDVAEDVAQRVSEIKAEADKAFLQKDYVKALEQYDQAAKVLPASHPDLPVFYNNKAACYMLQKRYKDAVRECSSALEAQPQFSKALLRRSKAYEQLGLYKQALTDVQAFNKTDAASKESQDNESRLREIVAGRRAGPANGTDRQAGKPAPKNSPFLIPAKCTLGNDTRVVQISPGATYAELLANVKSRFPAAGPCMIKYLDTDGDLVTITSQLDVQSAMQELFVMAQKQFGQHGPRLPNQTPTLKIQLIPVASEADVPKPPANELGSARAERQAGAAEGTEEQAVYEMDQWLVDFAHLFREQTGIDGDRPVDLTAMGMEKCQEALDAAIRSDAALPLFDKAIERFKEVTAVGLYNWANTHVCIARKIAEEAAADDKGFTDELKDALEKEFAEAIRRYKEALEFKHDFFDSYIGMGELDFERAKVYSNYIVPSVKPAETAEDMPEAEKQALQDKAQQEVNEKVWAALKRVTPSAADAAMSHWDAAVQHYTEALQYAQEQLDKEAAEGGSSSRASATENGSAEQPSTSKGEGEEQYNVVEQIKVLIGNLLFEKSQVLAALGRDTWRSVLDEAIASFNDANCKQDEIQGALRNHVKHAELDLPPPPAKDKPASGDASKKEAKGLPSLSKPGQQ